MEIVARARLRPDKDVDLIEVFERLPKHKDKSDVVREALRLMFFGSNGSEKVVLVENTKLELSVVNESVSDDSVDRSIDEFLIGI